MEKVVIVVANSAWFGSPVFMEPLATIPVLGGVLKDDFDYEVIDCNGSRYTEEQSFDAIKESGARIVLITALSVNLHRHYARVAELARQALPEAIIVMGGVYVTTCYEHIIQDKNVDYLMMGPAEERLCPFLHAILEKEDLSGMHGIAYRQDGKDIINPLESFVGDVKNLVSPDYTEYDLTPYIEHGFRVSNKANREVPIMTSYGCPHDCLFCAVRTVNGRKMIFRDVEDIIEEMHFLKEKYNIDAIAFVDDNILADRERAKQLFSRMIEEDFRFKIRFLSMPLWLLNNEILDLMVKAGTYALTLSVESGCNRTLREIIRKPFNREIVPDIVKMCKERGIFVFANIIIGFPSETWDEIRESIAFAEKCDADILNIYIATLLPKTDLYNMAVEQNCIVEGFDFFAADNAPIFSRGCITTEEFTPERLEVLRAYEWDRINFSTPEKRKKYCELRGFTEEELKTYRKKSLEGFGMASLGRKSN